MGKRLLFVIAVLFSVQLTNAQNNWRFADSTSQWNVMEWTEMMSMVITNVNQVVGDTIISGKEYQTIINSYYNPQKIFIRRDSIARVYRLFPDSEALIYNFSLNAGDTIPLYCHVLGHYINGIIDSVDSITLGKIRKRQFVHVDEIDAEQIWVDGIGSLTSDFANPAGLVWMVDGPRSTTICFFEHDSLLYHDTTYSSCFVDSLPGEIKALRGGHINISPNPVVSSYLNIEIDGFAEGEYKCQFFDVTGKAILQRNLVAGTNKLLLNGIAPGMYLYHIQNKEGLTTSGKLIVE